MYQIDYNDLSGIILSVKELSFVKLDKLKFKGLVLKFLYIDVVEVG